MKKAAFIASTMIMVMNAPLALASFGDIPPSHRYYEAITFLQERGIIKGYADNTFRPDQSINRAEFLKIVLGAFNIALIEISRPCFRDIKRSDWFTPYLCTAKELGIVSGLPDRTFKPVRLINKVEALKIILNAAQIPINQERSSFSDFDKSEWYAPFVTTAEKRNFLEEIPPYFNPGEFYTRGQVSEILYRVLVMRELGQEKYFVPLKPLPLSASEEQYLEWRLFAFDHINQVRTANGRLPLKLNHLLSEIATRHSQDMGINIKAMSHDGSLGETAHDRIKMGKVPDVEQRVFLNIPFPENIGWSGENVGMRNINNFGKNIEKAIIHQHEWFMDEPEDQPNHRTTMLSTLYPFSEVGIGLYLDEKGNLWITEDFISVQE